MSISENPIIDYFKLNDYLKDFSGKREKISQMIKSKEIIRVKKGLYVWNKNSNIIYNHFSLANLIYGPSYISGLTALSFYGAIPERVECIISINFKKKKIFDTPIGRYEYFQIPKEAYPQGYEIITEENNSYLIASKEKALLDTLFMRKEKTLENIIIALSDLRVDHSFLESLAPQKLKTFTQTILNKKELVSNLYKILKDKLYV